MKKDIHPQYFEKAQIKCACGAVYTVGSTREYMEIEICSNCHPFWIGGDRIVETVTAVGKFRERMKKAQEIQERIKEIEEKRAQRKGKTKKEK